MGYHRRIALVLVLLVCCQPRVGQGAIQSCGSSCDNDDPVQCDPREAESVVANSNCQCFFPYCVAAAGEVCHGYCNWPEYTGNIWLSCQDNGQWSLRGSCVPATTVPNTSPQPAGPSPSPSLPTIKSGRSGPKDKQGVYAANVGGPTNQAGSNGRYLLQVTGAIQRMSLPPTLRVNGRPAAVAPFTITGTSWQHHDATDVAACLSGALVSLANVNTRMSPGASPDLTDNHNQLQQEADCMAADVMSSLKERGILYASSMYRKANRLSAKRLKAELIKHYDNLVKVPSCLEVPTYMVTTINTALYNFMSSHGGVANFGPRGVPDHGPEALLEVSATVQEVTQARHPELCEGIKGTHITAKFLTSLDDGADSPESLWFFMAHDGKGCDVEVT